MNVEWTERRNMGREVVERMTCGEHVRFTLDPFSESPRAVPIHDQKPAPPSSDLP
jgi:hypothetical protein